MVDLMFAIYVDIAAESSLVPTAADRARFGNGLLCFWCVDIAARGLSSQRRDILAGVAVREPREVLCCLAL